MESDGLGVGERVASIIMVRSSLWSRYRTVNRAPTVTAAKRADKIMTK